MSTSSPKPEWLVIVPDFPNALQKRLDVRPAHLKELKPEIEAGTVTFGGALLEKQIQAGEQPQMKGSAMLVCADTEDDVRKRLESDAYANGGVWDVSKAQIIPFKCAVRTAM